MVRAVSESLAFAGAAWLAAFLCSTQACDLPAAETATFASAIDGETPRLTDGRTVRLIGAKAPMPPLGWRGDDPWPLVEDAKQGLEALALGNRSTLASADEAAHGHLLAQVFVVAGGERVWLQHEMVARGLARVYSFADNRAEARAKRRGVWGSLIHTYQLVEGRVVAVGEGRIRIYLNFAQDWRRDFTISVERKEAGGFAAAASTSRPWLASACACAAPSPGATAP
jgi:endonuclease YncB( thermonuclease family)